MAVSPVYLWLCICSCYGTVSSLSREAEPGVYVEAVGTTDPCMDHQEETKTEGDGTYRIRGLQVILLYHKTSLS